MGSLVHWLGERPQLRRPLLLTALEGFVDAGAAAGTAAAFLRHRWKADVVARFDRDELIDFRARRPTAVVDVGTLSRVEWPEIELVMATVDGPHDALLLLGPEPDMRWGAFCDAVVEVCRQTGVEQMIGLGAYPAPAPHTRPTRIRRASNLVTTVEGPLAEFPPVPTYTGPTGIARILQAVLAEAGVPAVGLLAEIPHYLAGAPNPAGALALARAAGTLFEIEVDSTELEAAAKLHWEQVEGTLAEHEEAVEMVRALEQHYDLGEGELTTGEDIAAEIERFLRSQSD
ncbi:MAG: PAC2 family protein [Egibacteraceae bacterium]